MEVVNPRAALLSNYEVLTLLRELEADNLVRTKEAIRVKKEEDTSGPSALGGNPHLEASENLRTIEVEAISYLSADYLPTSTQTEESITNLVKKLEPFSLTKAEKLQIVNLAPTMPVELYVIVEELEDRFGDRMNDILECVQSTVDSTTIKPRAITTNGINGHTHLAESSSTVVMIEESNDAWDDDADAVYDEDVYDDEGAGAGVEGDLEMDES
ncbi:hypothetical protein CPC08DRAFT_746170 [Agrocybe pediades]|nr:hypothetical protein CPC08DRAFT_746170 [Agrocybe pediades]